MENRSKPVRLLAALALAGCTLFEPAATPPEVSHCGSVAVAPGIVVTAGHCTVYGKLIARSTPPDIQFVYDETKGQIAKLRLSPMETGAEATFRGYPIVVTDPLMLSDGHFYVRGRPMIEMGDSGHGLWYQGELVGIAIGIDTENAVFVSAAEIAKQMRDLGI